MEAGGEPGCRSGRGGGRIPSADQLLGGQLRGGWSEVHAGCQALSCLGHQFGAYFMCLGKLSSQLYQFGGGSMRSPLGDSGRLGCPARTGPVGWAHLMPRIYPSAIRKVLYAHRNRPSCTRFIIEDLAKNLPGILCLKKIRGVDDI